VSFAPLSVTGIVHAMPMIAEFPLATPNSNPLTITQGSDGALWFVESAAKKFGRIDVQGNVTEYPLPSAGTSLGEIAAGPDGALWFTEPFAGSKGKIARITTDGVLTEYTVPISQLGNPKNIVPGPDGALWFTGYVAIGRITVDGIISSYPTPGAADGQYGDITSGPDGALWFTGAGGSDVIGRLTTSGQVITYQLPANSRPYSITSGPDGALWFTELGRFNQGRKVGRITTTGTINEYPISGANSSAFSITSGPDGALWFTDSFNNQIGRITTEGSISDYPIPTPLSEPWGITAGPDDAIWFTEADTNYIGRLDITDILVAAPADLNVQSPVQQPLLSWTAVAGADNYNVYRDGLSIGSTTAVSYTDTTPTERMHTYYVTAVNSAGESAPSNSVEVLVDRTAPTITASQNPAANADGWNNSNVAVLFSCDDESSGVSSCSEPVTLGDEGAGQTATGTATDNAGNVAIATTANINIDKTNPTITYTVTPAANSNGWNNNDVTVTFTCADALSGVKSCTEPATISTEGSAQSAIGTATDKAGNSTTVTVADLNIDKTAPSVSDVILSNSSVVYGSGLPVAFTATALDTLSGVTAGEYYVDADPGQGNGAAVTYANNELSGNADFSDLSVGNHTLYMRSQDAAGNWSAPASTPFAVSYPTPLAPSNLTAVTPTNQNLSLSWTATFDPATPPAVLYNIYRNDVLIGTSTATSYSDSDLPSDGTYTYYVTAVNQYGVESERSNLLVAVYDTTAPTVIYTLTPAANSAGWNNSNVTATFSCSDNLSGVQTCPSSYLFSNEAASQATTVAAIDNTGNRTDVTVSGINIDKTAPTVSNVTMSSTIVTPATAVNISANANDTLSGIAAGEYYVDSDPGQGLATPLAYSSGTLSASRTFSGLGLGQHTLYLRAKDAAGNWSTVSSVTFTMACIPLLPPALGGCG
jgi:virginiamycin B lyase